MIPVPGACCIPPPLLPPSLPATIVRGRGADSGTFYAIFSASNPDIGVNGYTGLQQRGACIMRSEAPEDPASWRAWDGQGFNVQVRRHPGDRTCWLCMPMPLACHLDSLPAATPPVPRPLCVPHLERLCARLRAHQLEHDHCQCRLVRRLRGLHGWGLRLVPLPQRHGHPMLRRMALRALGRPRQLDAAAARPPEQAGEARRGAVESAAATICDGCLVTHRLPAPPLPVAGGPLRRLGVRPIVPAAQARPALCC